MSERLAMSTSYRNNPEAVRALHAAFELEREPEIEPTI